MRKKCERANHLQEMTDEELQKRYHFSKANIEFNLSISLPTSTQRSNPISEDSKYYNLNTMFFIKCLVKHVLYRLLKQQPFYVVEPCDVMEIPAGRGAKCRMHINTKYFSCFV